MKTNKKKIDIEKLIIRVALISNLIIWVIIFLNLWLWHSSIVSAYVTGWNLCSIAMLLSVTIGGHINFKYEKEQYEWLLNHIGELEMMENTKKDMEDEKETK